MNMSVGMDVDIIMNVDLERLWIINHIIIWLLLSYILDALESQRP